MRATVRNLAVLPRHFGRRLPNLLAPASVVVLMLAASGAQAGTYHAIYTFQGGLDGASPMSSPVLDAQGRLCGTTLGGGEYGLGTVYRLTKPASGSGPWTEEILHDFSGIDGAQPFAPVTIGSDGTIYGTTSYGGSFSAGAVFKLMDAPGYPLTVLHSFGMAGGGYPMTGLIFGAGGLLYGTTSVVHVQPLTPRDYGFDYSVSPLGDQVAFKVLHTFGGSADGAPPVGLTGAQLNSPTDFFGTGSYGPYAGVGTLYVLQINPGGAPSESTIYDFGPRPDVNTPVSPPIVGQSSLRKTLYGCGSLGGALGEGGIYQVNSTDSGIAERVVYSFGSQANDPLVGGNRVCFLMQADLAGKLYGITDLGGAGHAGAFFELDPPMRTGGAWTEKVDVSFDARGPKGGYPEGMPARHGGIYYGATGTTVYELTP